MPVFNYDNRFEWQADDSKVSAETVTAPGALIRQYFKAHPLPGVPSAQQITAFSEVQAVCGGTTVIQETKTYDGTLVNRDHILIRSTGNADDMEISGGQYIDSAVKIYRPCLPMSGESPDSSYPGVSDQHPNQDTSPWVVTPDNPPDEDMG